MNERFKDNNDGTVIDTVTGLQWMRCAVGQEWLEVTGKRSKKWTCKGKKGWAMSWKQANELKIEFSGYTDWRLPTITELSGLLTRSEAYAIDNTAFPKCPILTFWSSTVDTTSLSGISIYCVSFFNRVKSSYPPTKFRFAVRLVRSPKTVKRY